MQYIELYWTIYGSNKSNSTFKTCIYLYSYSRMYPLMVRVMDPLVSDIQSGSNMTADRTLSVAWQCLPTHSWLSRSFQVHTVISQGSFWRSVVTIKPRKRKHGHIFYLRVAVCILCFAWNLTWRFGFPMPELHRGASSCVSQGHSGMSRDSERAGLRLLPSVRPAGGGAVRGLHAAVLQRPEVLPEHGGWVTFAAAHPGFRTMWTESGHGCHDESGPPGYKWWVKAALITNSHQAPVSSTGVLF